MTDPYDETRRPGPEPVDPWAEEEARRARDEAIRAQDEGGWVAEPGGMGPVPSRTWRRGNSRVVVGGCCLPIPLGCLTTVLAAGALAAVGVARRHG